MNKRNIIIPVLAAFSLSACGVSNDAGEEYLNKRGYTDVQPGEIDIINGCGKNVTASSFKAKDRNGESVEVTLCNGLFGIYRPLFD